jgi:hypothetical protein
MQNLSGEDDRPSRHPRAERLEGLQKMLKKPAPRSISCRLKTARSRAGRRIEAARLPWPSYKTGPTWINAGAEGEYAPFSDQALSPVASPSNIPAFCERLPNDW